MPAYIDCKQAAEAAWCSIYKIREAIKKGELKAYRPGKVYMIDPAELDAWVRSNTIEKSKKNDRLDRMSAKRGGRP